MIHTRSRRWLGLVAAASSGALAACTHTVKVEPIKVEPIDITLHIYLEADRKLDSFFGDDPPSVTPPPAAKPNENGGAES